MGEIDWNGLASGAPNEGVETPPADVLDAAAVVARWLQANAPRGKIMGLGLAEKAGGLKAILHTLATMPNKNDMVVVLTPHQIMKTPGGLMQLPEMVVAQVKRFADGTLRMRAANGEMSELDSWAEPFVRWISLEDFTYMSKSDIRAAVRAHAQSALKHLDD